MNPFVSINVNRSPLTTDPSLHHVSICTFPFRGCWFNRGSSFLLCRVNRSVLIRWRAPRLSMGAPSQQGSTEAWSSRRGSERVGLGPQSSAGPVCMGPNFRAVTRIKAGVSPERADKLLINGREEMLNISDYCKWGEMRGPQRSTDNTGGTEFLRLIQKHTGVLHKAQCGTFSIHLSFIYFMYSSIN